MKSGFFGSLVLLSLTVNASAGAGCFVVRAGSKTPFAGDSLEGFEVDKKALTTLQKAFTNLRGIEEVCKGKVRTCSACRDRYVSWDSLD